MRYLQVLKCPHPFFMRQESLYISKRCMRLKPLVCQCLSLTKRAIEYCLQQQNEYYLHPGWKGSRFLQQQSRYKTKVRNHCMMRGLQKVKRQISFSFRMMTLIWAPKAQSSRISFRSNKMTFITCLSTWKEPSGQSIILSKETNSQRINKPLWSSKT